MKSFRTLAIIISGTLILGCNNAKDTNGAAENSDCPELAMCVLTLRVVDDETGQIVPRIGGVNFKESLESIKATRHQDNPLKYTFLRKFSDDEGIVLASWIDSALSPSQLVITAQGYEPLIVDVLDEEKIAGQDIGVSPGKFSDMTRTVRMKRSEQGAVE